MTFDEMIDRICPVATEIVDADESAFGMEEHLVKALLCLIMTYAVNVPKRERAEVAMQIGACMMPLQALKRYDFPRKKES